MTWMFTSCIYFIDIGGWDEKFIKVSFSFYDLKIERITLSLVVPMVSNNSIKRYKIYYLAK